MEYIFLSALSSVCIFVLFKYIHQHNLPNLQPIVVNYFVASLLGLLLSPDKKLISEIHLASWLWVSFVLGILFILMFFTIAVSTQKAGISTTTVASKMSVIIPILFSILYYQEKVGSVKIVAVCLALIAVVAAVYKKSESGKSRQSLMILPLLLFMGLGLLDVLVKFSQMEYVKQNEVPVFTASLFIVAFLSSLIYGFTQKGFVKGFNLKVLMFGMVLGSVNFGSIYFIILALNGSGIDSSFVFGITNISIVAASVLLGRFAFKEKLNIVNWSGISLSLAAIYLMIKK